MRRTAREIGAAAARARRNRRDMLAASILERARGVCDICETRHGPLMACVNGIALCRECQARTGIATLGSVKPRVVNDKGVLHVQLGP